MNTLNVRCALRIGTFAVSAIFLFACVSQKTASHQSIPNPMPGIWAKTRSVIDRLESSRAVRIEWKKAAEASEKITSVSQLHAKLVEVELDAAERQDFDKLFHTSARTILFGFMSNYHALVFFDSLDRPVRVLKW